MHSYHMVLIVTFLCGGANLQ